MTWSGIRGHDAVAERFRRSLSRGRLASSFLFVGPPGIGKRTFALKLAQALLCETHPQEALEACGSCSSCQQVAAGSHPDLVVISKPADKSFIPIELLIGDREHRMRSGLCHDISLKPYRGGRKVAIIDDADFLNVEGANCLLKTLEEPPPRSLIILIGTSRQRQLPTIRSRCQIVRFAPLASDDVVELLMTDGHTQDHDEATRWAAVGGGSVQQALQLAEPELCDFRHQLLEQLSDPQGIPLGLTQEIQSFVEGAGKETSARRGRLRRVIGISASYYRHLMRELSGTAAGTDERLAAALARGQQAWTQDAATAAACLDCCLDAESHVDANASPVTVIECWLDKLRQLARG